MTTTTQLRSWWAPACTGPFVKVGLYGMGAVSVRRSVVPAVLALDKALAKHRYASRLADTGAYNCRKITGGTGYSLHAYGIALDINWQSNPYGPRLVTDMPAAMVAAIKAIRTNDGMQVWRWGGDYVNNKDAMHFEIVCSPASLGTGLNPATIPGSPTPQPAPAPTYTYSGEDDEMHKPGMIVQGKGKPEWWLTDLITKQRIKTTGHAAILRYLGAAVWDNATGGPFQWEAVDVDSIRTVT